MSVVCDLAEVGGLRSACVHREENGMSEERGSRRFCFCFKFGCLEVIGGEYVMLIGGGTPSVQKLV